MGWKAAKRIKIMQCDNWSCVYVADSVNEAARLTDVDPKLVSFIASCTNPYDITDDCLTYFYDSPTPYQKRCYYFRKKKILEREFDLRCDEDV